LALRNAEGESLAIRKALVAKETSVSEPLQVDQRNLTHNLKQMADAVNKSAAEVRPFEDQLNQGKDS
jgi:hypothetical protein